MGLRTVLSWASVGASLGWVCGFLFAALSLARRRLRDAAVLGVDILSPGGLEEGDRWEGGG